jgi:transposase-like protein
MPHEQPRKRSTPRRYTPDEKAQVVRLVSQLRADHGTVKRVAGQLGYGEDSVRNWVHQADTDEGRVGGTTTEQSERIKKLEQENGEQKRSNEMARLWLVANLAGLWISKNHL